MNAFHGQNTRQLSNGSRIAQSFVVQREIEGYRNKETKMRLTPNEAKWMSMLAVGIGSFVIGVIPACFVARGRRIVSRKLLISSLLCFGGGVLLATSILHMLPETRELLPEYAELTFCCGFLLLYVIDEVAHYFWVKEEVPAYQPRGILTLDKEPMQFNNQTQRLSPSTCIDHGLPNRRTRYQDQTHRDDIYEIGFNASSRNVASPSMQEGIRSLCYETTTSRTDASGPSAGPNKPRVTQYGTLSPLSPAQSSCCPDDETFLCHGNHAEPCANSRTGHVGLSLALTFHAALEGLAIGLQRNSSEVLLLMGAVVSHKFVIAFCLGLELAGSATSVFRNILAITLFSGGSVLGIGLGMLAVKVENSWAAVLIPVLQGLAGGTLLYVTVSEVLPRERARWHGNVRRSAGLVQFFFVLLGFTVVYCLNKYLDLHHHVIPRA